MFFALFDDGEDPYGCLDRHRKGSITPTSGINSVAAKYPTLSLSYPLNKPKTKHQQVLWIGCQTRPNALRVCSTSSSERDPWLETSKKILKNYSKKVAVFFAESDCNRNLFCSIPAHSSNVAMILLKNTQLAVKVSNRKVIQQVQLLLTAAGYRDWDIGVCLTGNTKVKQLNSQYRGKDKATDILSFPFAEVVHVKRCEMIVLAVHI